MAATFSKGVVIPELVFVAFQATFAAITCCLIVGAFAERIEVLRGAGVHGDLVHLHLRADRAHGVVLAGPGCVHRDEVVDASTPRPDCSGRWGALDFAGGTVVHINAGVAGLVGAYMVGKRIGFGSEAMTPHNLTMTMIGASLLWVGWFGFNAGSALEAGNSAALAFINTFLATACAVLAWMLRRVDVQGQALDARRGFGRGRGPGGDHARGGQRRAYRRVRDRLRWPASSACGASTGLKRMLGADDSLDVFGVHAVGGILGALLTGVFCSPALGGPGFVSDWVTGTSRLANTRSAARSGSRRRRCG